MPMGFWECCGKCGYSTRLIKAYPLPNSDELDEWDLKEVKHFEWIVYEYKSESYEGGGHAILYDEEKYYHHDMGHCSCYGPMEHFEPNAPYGSLKKLRESFSKGLLEEVQPLFDFIKQKRLTK